MSLDVLFFEVRGRRCALPVAVVREVLAMPAVTPVPFAPSMLRGLVPVRGQVLPLLDAGPQGAGSGGESAEAARASIDEPERIVLVEIAPATSDPTSRSRPGADRAAFAATRMGRLGRIHEGHSRQPPRSPRFVSATVFDVEGPALLLDAAVAIETLRQSLLYPRPAETPAALLRQGLP